MDFQSCPMIAGQYLNVNGRIDTGGRCLTLCCENIPNIPGVAFSDDVEETLERFIGMRTLVIAESARKAGGTHFGCADCVNYREGQWEFNPFISYVNLSMYPAPCQCRCRYCGVYKEPQVFTPEAKQAYERLFGFLELAVSSGVIDPDARWQVSSGEITIHPYKDRILELVRGKNTIFFTNAFLFDKTIAQNLHNNPGSAINLSIDAGTPKTWRKVKGVDNFETVTSNLVEYHNNSAKPGQITLKYIVLPDVNDTYEDYASLMEIIKLLEVRHLSISRDTNVKYERNDEYHTKLMGAAAYLLAMCYENGITNDMFAFSKEEQDETVKLAGEILRREMADEDSDKENELQESVEK